MDEEQMSNESNRYNRGLLKKKMNGYQTRFMFIPIDQLTIREIEMSLIGRSSESNAQLLVDIALIDRCSPITHKVSIKLLATIA